MPTTLRHFQRPRSRAYLLGLALLAVLSAMAQPTSWNWSRAAGSGSDELIRDLAVDPASGDIYAVGTYEAAGPFSLAAPAGSSDGFLVKFDANGTLQWSVPIGGTDEDKAYGVAFDPGGRVYVTGFFRSSISAVLASTPQTIISLGGSDMFLSCFNSNGQLQWMERGGGNSDDVGYSVVTNTSGVFVHGIIKGNTTFGSSTLSQLNSWNDQMFVARYPLMGGSPTWVISGGGDGQELAERMAVDASSIYVTGRFEGTSFTWRSATGGALSSASATNDEKNGYVARISNVGSVQWTRVIDTPNGPVPEFNAIAIDGSMCYLGGRAPAGTVFPGLTTTTASTAQDALYIAALDASNGNGLWLRTAQGTNSEQTEVFDITTGPAGQIYLSGAYDLNMTWDDGSTHTGSDGRELFVCRMTTTGQLLWLMKETATGDELPLAIAVGPMNKVVVGGAHTEQLRLSPLIYAHGSSTNAFVGALTDPVQTSTTPSAAQWKHFGPMCSSDAILDLNSRLRGYADNWVGSPIDVTSPSLALGLPNGSGAIYSQPGANGVLDLGDTATAGANLTLRLRSQTSGMPSRLEIAFSIDGTNWSLYSGIPQVNNAAWHDLSIISPTAFRYVRITLSVTSPNSPFLLDGLTFLNETQTGGTWSGPGVSATGMFNPIGLAGWQTITYTVMVNSNPFATARTIWVGPEPGAVINGASVVCPGSTGTLMNLAGLTPLTSVVGWGTSPDGVNWSITPGSALSFTTGPINGTLHVMARVFSIGCGARNTPVHQITAIDTVPPIILNCPTALVLGTDQGSCFNHYAFPIIHSTDNCDTDTESGYTAFWLPANQAVWVEATGWTEVDLGLGTHTMREIHQDDSGNSTTCTWTVTVVDNEAPSIICPASIAQLNVGTSCTVALPNYSTSASVSDNCISNGGLVYTQSPAPGTQLALGSHTVTLTVTQNGQSASCSFLVTVVDDTPPTIVGCPATTMTVNVPAASCSAVVTWDPPTLTNTCSGSVINQTSGPASGSVFPIGQTIITYAATDASGNIATCSFMVDVKDATGPTITCIQDIAIEATSGLCGAVVTYPVPTAIDNCGTVTVSRIAGPASGSVFPVGTTVVRHRASDNAVPPNTTDCFFWVTVFDATAPSFTTCSDITANASPTSCAAVVNYALPTVNEPCTTCATGSVPNGYTALGTYQGRSYYYRTTNSTWQAANNAAIAAGGHLAVIRDAAHNAWLRSTVDAAGGTNQSYWVALNDAATEGSWRWTNGAPVSFFNWDSNEPNSNGGNEDYTIVKANGKWNDEKNTSSVRSVIEVEASCFTPVLTSGAVTASGAAFPVGTSTVTYASTDAAGNTSTCSFTITVTDDTPPTITCPTNVTVNAVVNGCGAVVNYTAPVGIDNCAGATTIRTAGPANGSTFPLGATTVTHTVTDAAGLTASCSFQVIVVDNIAPTIIGCPGNITRNITNMATCARAVSWNAPTVSDNCSGVTITQTAGQASGSQFTQGVHTVTYTATDGAGNTSTCSFTVTINDVDAPSVNCPLYDEYPLYLSGPGCSLVFPDLRDSLTISDCSAWTNTMVPAPGTVFTEDTLLQMTMWIEDAHGNGLWNNHTVRITGQNSNNTTASACGSYVWAVNGTTYTASGTYHAVVGCVTEILNLTINTPGGACDDGDATTGNDVLDASCNCAGQPIDCAGIPGGTAFLDNCGTCVGGNTSNTACTQDCAGVWGGTAILDNCGTCVGGNTGNTACTQDCAGVWGGSAFLDNCGTCVGGNTGLIACVADCNGEFGGTAFLDNCGTCVGGNTGLSACVADCNGVFGGTAFLDNCGTCIGGNTGNTACTQDCAGVWGGTAFLDNCGVCVGGNTGLTACVADCNGVFGGTAFLDNCGTCVGGNTGLIACVADCNGVFGGSAFLDNCGACVGGNTGLITCVADCNGVFGGSAFLDNCGVCVGGNTGLIACVADCNGVFGGTAFLDNCGTCVGGNTGNTACTQDCAGVWGGTAFLDNCGVCVGGNTGLIACVADCNGVFGGTAFLDNCGACVGGNTGLSPCLADCNGEFGGTAFLDNCGTCVGGNTGNTACTQDCAGVWGGTAFLDNCGTCVGGNSGLSACVADCNGVFGGTAFLDNCGTCVGGNTGLSACLADCNGVFGGTAFLDNCGTCVGGNTGLIACVADCNGVFGGTAFLDNCGTCVGGNTGNTACTQDCAGVWGGTAFLDNCGTCVGGNTGLSPCLADCSGEFGGTAFLDNCGTCVGGNTGLSACVADCNGAFGGTAFLDNCGTCVGGNTGLSPCLADCNGEFGGTAFLDNCGTCVGGNTGLSACVADCNGVFGGTAFLDNCGTCVGGNTGNTACTQDCAGVWGGTAFLDNCGSCVGGNTGLIACVADCNGEFGGTAFLDNCGTCVGGNTGLSACLADCNGVFGGTAFLDNCGACVGGNTGLSACVADCNGVFGGTAFLDNCGTCVGGNTGNTACTQDCAGVWGGTAFLDNCGTCVGGNTGLSPCLTDCSGEFGGTAFLDNCGTCVGGNTGNTACTQDCAGVWGGTAFLDNCGTCVGGNTGLSPCLADCNGEFGGTAFLDNCGTCVGGNTGLSACVADCNGVFGGTAFLDNCGTCVGGNTGNTACTQDCAGVWGGTAFLDNCGSCVGGNTGLIACVADCNGEFGGTAFLDNCGTCVGGNTSLIACAQDCAGLWGGSAVPGTLCDDGSANTINDTWNSDCQCVGTPVIIDCTSNAGSDQTVCGPTTTLSAVGTGAWSGPSTITFASVTSPVSVITASQPGTYDLYWTVTEGTCVSVDTVVVILNAQADASFAYAQSTYCMGDTPPAPWMAQVGGIFSAQSSGLVIDPSTGVIEVGASAQGDHIVTYSIGGPCPSSSSQQVSIAQNADATWTTPAPMCGDATPIELNSLVTGTTGGTWSGAGVSGSTFTPAGLIGSINITYTATIGECTSHVTQALVVAAPVVADAGTDVTVCGSSAVMNATSGQENGGWSEPSGIINIEPVVSPNATVSTGTFGTYALVWTVDNGVCTASDTVLVHFTEPITDLWVNAGPDQDLAVVDHTALLGSASSGSTLSWWVLSGSGIIANAHDSSTTITGLSMGDNLVVLTATIDQCSSASDTVTIHVDDLFIPEGFSPNGDDVNDKWEIRGIEAYPMSSLQIFNRWGHLVYRSDSYRNEWNGKGRNAGELPDDTYFYVLNLGGERTYNGHIILKR
jgi:gliding motility-associated-like protein